MVLTNKNKIIAWSTLFGAMVSISAMDDSAERAMQDAYERENICGVEFLLNKQDYSDATPYALPCSRAKGFMQLIMKKPDASAWYISSMNMKKHIPVKRELCSSCAKVVCSECFDSDVTVMRELVKTISISDAYEEIKKFSYGALPKDLEK